jgi:PAS domain S-box-containing protein
MRVDDAVAGQDSTDSAAALGVLPGLDPAALFQLSPNPYVLLDPALTIVGMNEAYLRVTMRSRAELVGRNMFDAFPSDPASIGAKQLRSSLERALRERRPDHLPLIHYDIPRADGNGFEQRVWSATHTPLLNADGEVAYILQHTVDVTELHRLRQLATATAGVSALPEGNGLVDAESGILSRAQAVQDENRALQHERLRLRGLFEQAPGFMAVLQGPQHVFELVNVAYLRLVGHRDLQGKRVREALPEVAGQGFFELLDHVHASGEPFVGRGMRVMLQEEPGAAADERFVDFIYQPIRDDAGRVSGIFVQGHDITEQKRAEAALRETEERFRLVAESAPVMLWMGDAAGKCVYLNRQQREFWGVAFEDVASFDWNPTIHPDDRAALFEPLSQGMRLRTGFQAEARYRRADGEYRLLHTDAQPRFDAAGQFLGMIGVNVDITVARQAEIALQDLNATLEQQVTERTRELHERDEALRQAQKMEVIGQLTGGVAHDFNNLLQVVVGNLEILQRNLPTDAGRLRRSADNAMNGALRASTLTQRLLAFSRRQPLDPRPLDPNKLVSDMSELLHRTLGETIAVEAVLAAGLWSVDADANQLESAILNLALNARDAMPDGGRLTIETANTRIDDGYALTHAEVLPGQYVVICVSDTGTGMSRETLARVFEPFFTTKEPGKGTGLGLSMVYGFVKQSGGHVQIYSEVGQGTTVKVYLPRLIGAVQEEETAEAAIVPEGTRDETILVVEDDDDVRTYSVEILRELGYRVLEAHDGPSALRLLQRQSRVDLLFTDVVLPGGLNGADLSRAARALKPGLRVLFTTGYARDAIVHHGRLDAGVQLITKPFSYAGLATKVRDVLDLAAEA